MRLSLPKVLSLTAFRNLWLGQAISQLGDAFYYVAFLFMVKKVTGSDTMVGAVGALETLPFLLFGPYAGVLADRLDRRLIMLVSDVFSGLFLLMFGMVVFALGKPLEWMLLLAPFVLSSVRVFFMPAKGAALPALVPSAYLPEANGVSMTTGNLMPMAGLALSAGAMGVLYAQSAPVFYAATIGLNALTFLGSAVFISKLPKVLPDRENTHESHVLADLRDGMRYLKGRRDLIVLTALLAVFRLSVAPFFVAFIKVNEQWFGGQPQTLAWMEFSFFLGMVLSSAYSARFRARYPARAFAICLGIAGLTVGGMAFGAASIWWFIGLNVVAGLAIPLGDVPLTTYLQRSVPDAYRGRVNSVRDMIATGMMPIGMTLGGKLIGTVGPAAMFVIMGVGMVGSCIGGLLDPVFRNAEMPGEDHLPDLPDVASAPCR